MDYLSETTAKKIFPTTLAVDVVTVRGLPEDRDRLVGHHRFRLMQSTDKEYQTSTRDFNFSEMRGKRDRPGNPTQAVCFRCALPACAKQHILCFARLRLIVVDHVPESKM